MIPSGFISVRELQKHYQDGKGNDLHILRGVNLSVGQGETVAIMGASGAGKSTLLHLMGALDQPDAGTIEIAGVNLGQLDEKAGAIFRNRTVGFVFQFHYLLMDFSALENVMMPIWIREGRTIPAAEEALALLRAVGIEERAHHKPAQLSGGEQQRLAIARAIANRPTILLADEPTGNLDEETGAKICDLLLRLNEELGLTLVLVTHNTQIAARMTAQFSLDRGKLLPAPPHRTNG